MYIYREGVDKRRRRKGMCIILREIMIWFGRYVKDY